MTMSYVELHASSAFSFLRGGSFPVQLAETAAEMGMLVFARSQRRFMGRNDFPSPRANARYDQSLATNC
jgi:DNA polymerase III alpha subunit